MITISINGRLLDAIYALVASMAAGAAPETAPEAPVEKPETAPVEKPVEKPEAPAGRARKKAAPREHVAVTRSGAPVATVETAPEPIKPDEALLAQVRPVETPLAQVRPVETPPLAPVAIDDEWPTTLTKPSSWDYDGQGASWRAANQIGTAELGAAIQRVYVDHADIIKMPSVRVAMSKLGVQGWWRCVAKNIAEARDASNRPLDITPKRETQND